jgi:GT2 family glycosyltransferase
VSGAPAADDTGVSTPLVGIVLLNWNGTDDTIECLDSLSRLSYANRFVIVVDNGSRQPCTAAVMERRPDVEVMESGENLGFTGGSNIGIRRALDRGAGYVWLLNNDTLVEPDALTALVEAAEAHQRFGIVGSKIYFAGGERIIDHAGCAWDPSRCRTGHIGLGEVDVGQYDELTSVDFVDGCSMLARKTVIEEIGLLDDRFFAYLEDLDWCTRARQAGWDIAYVPGSVIHHKGGSVAEPAPYQHYLFSRNLLRYVSKHHPRLLRRALYYWMKDCLVAPVVHRRWELLGPFLRAFKDWLLGELRGSYRDRGGSAPS